MGKVDLKEWVSVSRVSAVREILGINCATEQGIRSQIRQWEANEKTSQEVGFEVMRHGGVVFLRFESKELRDFLSKMDEWVAKNKPNLV